MSSQSFSFGASPSVTKERWFKHAVHKLAKGYNLIVNKDRKVANFYKGFGDFESCSYKTARKLITQEFVELIGEHDMGQEYRLKSDQDIDIADAPDEDDTDEAETEAVDAIEEAKDVIEDEDLEEVPGDDDEEEHKYDDDE